VTEADAIGDALAGTDLGCSRCGDGIERGYLVVAAGEPLTDTAVCDTCGWSEVGHSGCAPELRDFDAGDALVRVESVEEGYGVTVTEE